MCVCIRGWLCAVHEHTCAMTRQGMPCSCLFHLMRQSQALIDSIYLALTLICQDAACQTASGPTESVSQLQNVFHFFLCRNKGVQTCIHSSSKRSPILACLHFSFMRLSVKSILLEGSQCWHMNLKSGSRSFFFLNAFLKNQPVDHWKIVYIPFKWRVWDLIIISKLHNPDDYDHFRNNYFLLIPLI